MTCVEQCILQNQAAILALMAQIVPNAESAKTALEYAELIHQQIKEWSYARPMPSENPYFQGRH